jgi:SAM-dependent methyltransferase
MDGSHANPRVRDAPDVIAQFAARASPDLLAEFMAFTRCLFVTSDAGFHDCDRGTVQAFLQPALGLEVYDIRQRMFDLLRQVAVNPAFDVPEQPGSPRWRRLARRVRRRRYWAEVTRRGQQKRPAVTAAAVTRLEWRSADFYAAVAASRHDAATAYVPPTYHGPVVAVVAKHLAGMARPRILDIGAGPGTLLRLLVQRLPDARPTGTNLLRVPGTAIALGEHSPFPDACFDAVTATKLLEHAVDPGLFVREMARVLKPGGICVAVTNSVHMQFLSRNPLSYAEALASTVWPGVLPQHPGMFLPLTPLPMYHRAFTAGDLRRLFAPSFSDVTVTAMNYAHLRRFGLARLARHLPLVRRFGGELIVTALRPR